MGFELDQLRGQIIVSVQAAGTEPFNTPEYLSVMAESVLCGGAAALRMAQAENIRYFKQRRPDVPVIGITKPELIPANAQELVYITPTLADVALLADCCEIVAMDATQRPRPGGEALEDIVREARRQYPDLLLMADVATLEEGLQASVLGFDLISTTLSGYTTETAHLAEGGPDFDLCCRLVEQQSRPVMLEGRIWSPSEATQAFALGAFAVVIGSAITRPHHITRRFVEAASQ